MKKKNRFFYKNQSGATMVEFLLTLGLAAAMIPFLLGFQTDRLKRAENIAITGDMENFQNALEKYIEINQNNLQKTIGKNITRIELGELTEYGASVPLIEKYDKKIQLRILKSNNSSGQVVLQGVVVLNDTDITAFRTNEIVNLGDNTIGYIEENQAYGASGSWSAKISDLDISDTDGLIKITKPKISQDDYLWRLPSDSESDATMLNSLNLAGRDILDINFLDGASAKIDEFLKANEIISSNTVFQTRSTIQGTFSSSNATVDGTLSSDSTSMYVSDTLTLQGIGRFNRIEVNDLWVNDLNLSGFSVSSEFDDEPAILKVNRKLELSEGTISAYYTTVGFDGSITPMLRVSSLIQDPSNPAYFWDASTNTARFADITFGELNRLAADISYYHQNKNTVSAQIFQTPANNKNATVTDFINALNEIENNVKIKYQQLNLE